MPTEKQSVLEVTITEWSGMAEPPVVVGASDTHEDEPQADQRPALRLVKGDLD